jgi:hypothetical protein
MSLLEERDQKVKALRRALNDGLESGFFRTL